MKNNLEKCASLVTRTEVYESVKFIKLAPGQLILWQRLRVNWNATTLLQQKIGGVN